MIKFPTQINPARLTVQLRRVDSIIPSPLTNVHQVASRGNPAWIWTYEYVDLSLSERDIVQAFLLRAKGAVNTFKITDPGDYEIRGTISDWLDVFSGHGSFTTNAGSSSLKVNSYFGKSAGFNHHITDDGTVRFEKRGVISNVRNLAWPNAILDSGKAYVQRIKHFNGVGGRQFGLAVGSGGTAEFISAAPTPVESDDSITAPFVTDANTYDMSVIEYIGNSPMIGDFFEMADYRVSRCALVANSEQLFNRSNGLTDGDWFTINATVDSGWWDSSPTGVTSGGWKLYVDNGGGEHTLDQLITKPMTEDLYTFGFYARPLDADMNIRLELSDSAGNNQLANFNLVSGAIFSTGGSGIFERQIAKAWDVGSGTFRCQLTCMVSSLSNLKGKLYIVDSNSNVSFTGNGSAGILIFGPSLRKFPFMGQYYETQANTITGAVAQTGSRLRLDGFDAGDIIKAGQRFEVVNRFNNVNSSYFERSEFKRITKEAVANPEGSVIIEFDPPIRNAPVFDRSNIVGGHLGETMHNPVIFHQPEMKARLMAGTIQYVDKPLMATDIIFEVVEDMTE